MATKARGFIAMACMPVSYLLGVRNLAEHSEAGVRAGAGTLNGTDNQLLAVLALSHDDHPPRQDHHRAAIPIIGGSNLWQGTLDSPSIRLSRFSTNRIRCVRQRGVL